MKYKDNITGILVVNKPKNITSRDVVNKIQKLLNTKAGHTGTLDPIATGVLVITFGKATKLSEIITAETKEYIAEAIFGVETDTLDIEGKVLVIGLKTTKIQDLKTKNVLSIANRNIDRALVISNIIDIDIPLQYEAKKQDIEAVLEKVIEKAKENEKIKDIKYVGIKKFGDSAIEYKLRITTNPEMRGICRIYVNGIIKEIFEQENITIPYTQIDIHTK